MVPLYGLQPTDTNQNHSILIIVQLQRISEIEHPDSIRMNHRLFPSGTQIRWHRTRFAATSPWLLRPIKFLRREPPQIRRSLCGMIPTFLTDLLRCHEMATLWGPWQTNRILIRILKSKGCHYPPIKETFLSKWKEAPMRMEMTLAATWAPCRWHQRCGVPERLPFILPRRAILQTWRSYMPKNHSRFTIKLPGACTIASLTTEEITKLLLLRKRIKGNLLLWFRIITKRYGHCKFSIVNSIFISPTMMEMIIMLMTGKFFNSTCETTAFLLP